MPDPLFNITGSERQTLDWILNWRTDMAEALVERRATVKHAIQNGSAVSPLLTGMTFAEVDDFFDDHRRELDRLTMLNLVASTEAGITDDYFRRIDLKLKDVLSKAYRKWYKGLSHKKKEQPSFDEDGIFSRLKESKVINTNLIGHFRECLRVRHWIGHGRRWNKPLEVEKFDPDDVYDRAKALLQALHIL